MHKHVFDRFQTKSIFIVNYMSIAQNLRLKQPLLPARIIIYNVIILYWNYNKIRFFLEYRSKCLGYN